MKLISRFPFQIWKLVEDKILDFTKNTTGYLLIRMTFGDLTMDGCRLILNKTHGISALFTIEYNKSVHEVIKEVTKSEMDPLCG